MEPKTSLQGQLPVMMDSSGRGRSLSKSHLGNLG